MGRGRGTHGLITALFRMAASEGELGVVRWCLSNDAGGLGIIDSRAPPREPCWERNALIEAASRGHQEIVRCVVGHG
jgi:hypothetical protein